MTILGWLLLCVTGAEAQDYLQRCRTRQANFGEGRYFGFSFEEKRHELGHSSYPWQQTAYAIRGSIHINGDNFLKQDTLATGSRTLYSRTVLTPSELLIMSYGKDSLSPVSRRQYDEQVFMNARFSPVGLIAYFLDNGARPVGGEEAAYAVYETKIREVRVRLYIDKATSLLHKATTLSDDELFGDVLTTITYSDYADVGGLSHPGSVRIEKINGQVTDTVVLSGLQLVSGAPTLLERPEGYAFAEPPAVIPQISTERYSDHIWLMELPHTDDRVMIVEFKDFLLVAEAPMNSENGELIISEARKIAPGKPVKYFVFGHYHPHYLGGVRPFVHKGARIICTGNNEEYVRYIVEAPRTIVPDSLQLQPRPLQTELVGDSLRITDGSYELVIYFIGNKSAHTDDFLIYYFPAEKVLFQDDLVWIKREGPVTKAGARQAGLYRAVRELGLDIETIIQSWPVRDYGVKTIIPFEDLERSMQVD